nr:hypothetical protein [Porphyromonas cangingivalis]
MKALPQNPMRGTLPSSSFLVSVMASKTYFKSFITSGLHRLRMSDSVLSGRSKTGPSFSKNDNPNPMASGTVRMSEKMIAASRS